MSTARSIHRSARVEWLVLLVGVLAVCGSAHALKSDRGKPVNVKADHTVMSQDNEKVTLTGNVRIDQGSLHADGTSGIGTFDQDNTLQRVVLTGSPAHFQQKLDSGNMVHGSAASIDYKVSENTVILTGDATVVQQGRGSFHGAKLTYNTDTGEIVGEGGGGQVHMTFQPKPKPVKSAPGATPPPAPGSAPAVPAPASTAGTR